MIERAGKLIGLAAVAVMAAAMPTKAQDLNGAGATFPDPIYKKWFNEYKTAKNVEINYQAIGSGGGIKALTDGTVDFGASDAPMSDEEISKLKAPAFHIPTVLGAVVVTYNLPEVTKQLMLTGPVIADIYLGKVTKWNAPEIAALNKGVDAAEQGHPRRPPLGCQRHDLHLHRLPDQRESRRGRRDRARART